MRLSGTGRLSAIRGLTLAHDMGAAGVAMVLGLMVRLGPIGLQPYWTKIAAFMVISGVVGYFAGLNSGIWRYASLSDLEAVIKTATISILIFALAMFLTDRLDEFPRSTMLASWAFMILLLSGSRVAYRVWRTHRSLASGVAGDAKYALIIGATDRAEGFIRAAGEGRVPGYRVAGIIDQKNRRAGRAIRGIRVIDTLGNLETVLTNLAKGGRPINAFVLAEYSTSGTDDFDHLADVAERHNIELLRLPDVGRLGQGRVRYDRIVPERLQLEDLLPRRVVSLGSEHLAGLYEGATVLLTGAGGSIGSELCRQVIRLKPKRMVLVDSSEFLLHEIDVELRRAAGATDIVALIGNVRDRAQMFEYFETYRPEIVFHAAALKHVPIVERQPLEGLKTNVLGTRNVADAALKVGAKAMVLISTDKAVNPTNIMGASKRMAESYCQALDVIGRTHFVTVRFGNVLGSAGSVIPLFARQIAAGGPVTITHPEIERYFMTIPEAVQLVLHATRHGVSGTDADRGRIFVLDMGKPVKIVDVARKMIRLQGLRPDQDIAIKFVGLRPGEKMFEELFERSESLVATDIEGVLSAEPRRMYDHNMIAQMFEELRAAIEEGAPEAAEGIVARLVPEYQAPADGSPSVSGGASQSAKLHVVGSAKQSGSASQ